MSIPNIFHVATDCSMYFISHILETRKKIYTQEDRMYGKICSFSQSAQLENYTHFPPLILLCHLRFHCHFPIFLGNSGYKFYEYNMAKTSMLSTLLV